MLGIFANFVYNTAMNLTGQYFPYKHQALATCLASAGVSFGKWIIYYQCTVVLLKLK